MKRRHFVQASVATTMAGPMVLGASANERTRKPATLGGTPVRDKPFQSWPKVAQGDEDLWLDVLHQKAWCRLDGNVANQFEQAYARALGVKDCIAVNSGTHSLYACCKAMDIGPGDEVLVPPYTFVATVNVPLLCYALPVYVDTDRDTFQMDPAKIEEKITERTRAIMPVHLGGNVCDMDAINAIARKHNLYVLEDACQAHYAEWKHKRVGGWGDAGCFSFQVTKNLSSGEGGAVTSNNMELMDRVYSFHSNGRERQNTYGFSYLNNGTNMRMTEFQAALLLRGLTRIERQANTRARNAAYLKQLLADVPGIHVAKEYAGTTMNAYHLFMFRYDADAFDGLPRETFLAALQREGIPCSSGYSPLNKEPFFERTLRTRGFETVYGKETIDAAIANTECPENDKLCSEAVWLLQFMMLGDHSDMEQIADAIRKIQRNAGAIKQA